MAKISRKNVDQMFDSIAPKYDLLNHLLSFNVDKYWRNKAVSIIKGVPHDKIADFATGTGDFAITLAKKLNAQVLGLDFSKNMLACAKNKVEKLKLTDRIGLQFQDCQHTSLPTASIDVVTIAFGIRNFNDPDQGLREMHRVLKEGGYVVILEFATPRKGVMGHLVKWYYKNVMPFMGRLIASNAQAYTYLPETIYEFPNGNGFLGMMRGAGFTNCYFRSLTFNMVNLYFGQKI